MVEFISIDLIFVFRGFYAGFMNRSGTDVLMMFFYFVFTDFGS